MVMEQVFEEDTMSNKKKCKIALQCLVVIVLNFITLCHCVYGEIAETFKSTILILIIMKVLILLNNF